MEDDQKIRSSIDAGMNSQRLRLHEQGLHCSATRLLCMHYGFQFSVLIGFLGV